jgi:redox-sensing transcriptional repressor
MDDGAYAVHLDRIPEATVLRLPVYQRILHSYQRQGLSTISSADLGRLAGANPASVRRDLSRLGSLGTRGTGYDVTTLVDQIDRAFASTSPKPVVLIGVGNLGRALIHSKGFFHNGPMLVGAFDADPSVIGTEHGGLIVQSQDELEAVVADHDVKIAVLSLSAPAAQGIAERLVRSGVNYLLNFASTTLHVADHVTVRYVDLSIELQALGFYQATEARNLGHRSIGTAGIST